MERLLLLKVNSRIIKWGSPFWLFTLYTNWCIANLYDVLKFADDTAVVGLIIEDETEYSGCVDEFVDWCQASFR